MPRLFIGEHNFYPSWARTQGRWMLQRVFTTEKSRLIYEVDEGSRPDISFESLVWVPPKPSLKRAFLRSVNEGSLALAELHYIPLVCFKCEWEGVHPRISISFKSESMGPEGWQLRCPECSSLVGPDIEPIRPELIIERWLSIGRPALDHPAASTSTNDSIGPIEDLQEWIRRYQPMAVELAYIGQQLWPTFSKFIQSVHPGWVGFDSNETKDTSQLTMPYQDKLVGTWGQAHAFPRDILIEWVQLLEDHDIKPTQEGVSDLVWNSIKFAGASRALQAFHKVWYTAELLAPDEEDYLKRLFARFPLGQTDFDIWLRQTVRQVFENAITRRRMIRNKRYNPNTG